MHAARFDALLESGSVSDLEDALNYENCVLIDWRAEPDEVFEAFQRFLPDGFLRFEVPDETSVVIAASSRKAVLHLRREFQAIPLADDVARLLRPDYSAYLLRSSIDSDTAVYVVRSERWWEKFRTAHAERFSRLFTDESHSH